MCSQTENGFLEKRGPKVQFKFKNGLVQCKKCENNAFVLLQRKDPLCRDCLYDYCSHKFRATIGKSKLVKPGERVLIAFSGGPSSAAMIHMIKDGLNADQHRRLLFVPSILHIEEGILSNKSMEERSLWCEEITKLMHSFGWPFYITSLEMALRNDDVNQFYYQIANDKIQMSVTSQECTDRFNEMFSKIKSLTAKEEFVKCLKYQLINEIAKKEGFDKVFLGNNTSNLSVDLITQTAQGKGSQLHCEIGFSDNRHDVMTLKPMREFVIKELVFYNIMFGVESFTTPSLTSNLKVKSSIRKLTESFVFGLQEEFPATVYTVLRTGNKLKSPENCHYQKCVFCNSSIDTIDKPLCSAFEALVLTNKLSKNLSNDSESTSQNLLCYGCRTIANELESSDKSFVNFFHKKTSKHDIKQYLVGDSDDD